MLIEVELFQIIITEGEQTQIIVLKDRENDDRRFPIYINYTEAIAIDREIKNFKPLRPLTHDLLVNIVEQLGAKVEQVIINDMVDNTYYAQLAIKGPRETLIVDARPSDAIAIAVRTKAPIFAEESLIRSASE